MTAPRVLVVGDGFIGSGDFADALAPYAAEGLVEVHRVDLPGTKKEQHSAQQLMEVSGPEAVEVPPAVLDAVTELDPAYLVLHFAGVPDRLMAAAPSLRLVAVARAGLENVDIEAATRRGVAVTPAMGRNAGAVAELQIGLMLAEARNIARADASIKSGGWRKDFPGERVEIFEKTIGMIGFGHVGRVFMSRLRGFDVKGIVYDPYARQEDLDQYGIERVGTLDEVCERGDFVVLMARLSPETHRFVGAEQFALMKPTAYFINVSRSRLVDYDALYDALKRGVISGAGIDVFDDEPIAADSPWRSLDNVTMTTHFGGDTNDTITMSSRIVAGVVAEHARSGEVPETAVNRAALLDRS